MNREAPRRFADRLVIAGIGLLMLVGIVAITKVFMRGFVAGVAVGMIACIVVLMWMSRAARGGSE